jgi:site-specific DNA recombinase
MPMRPKIKPKDSMASTSKSIAIYCRVSTDEQAREGVSLEEQKERLTAYCRAMGWSTDPLIYVDDGYSAKNTDRPALKQLLQAIKSGHISKVMVTKLDRMSRRLLDLLTLIDSFQDNQVTFISTSEAFDTETPSGRLTLQVLGAVAEFERERIRERVIDNMFHAAKHGKWLTQSPYGYRLDEKKLVLHEPEAEIVRKIYDFYLNQGYGFYTIAKWLNKEGIPSRQNKQWSIRAIKLMLTNPVFKGTLVWNRVDSSKDSREERGQEDWVVIPDCLPVIIASPVWERVQERINGKKVPPRAQTSPHLLGGLLKCGNCGSSMSISWSGWPNRIRVYRCSANKNKGTCTSRTFRADEVESWFKAGLEQISNNFVQDYSAKLVEIFQTIKRDTTEQHIRQARARYERKVEAYTAGLIELQDLMDEKKKWDDEILNLENKVEPEASSFDIKQLETEWKSKLQNGIAALNMLPVEKAKALIRTLVERVTLLGEKELEISFCTQLKE